MPRLIWIFAGCTLTLFVLSRGGSDWCYPTGFFESIQQSGTQTLDQESILLWYTRKDTRMDQYVFERMNSAGGPQCKDILSLTSQLRSSSKNRVWPCCFRSVSTTSPAWLDQQHTLSPMTVSSNRRAAAWRNQPNDMCAQRRFRSAWASSLIRVYAVRSMGS